MEPPAAGGKRRGVREVEGWGTLCTNPLISCFCRATIGRWGQLRGTCVELNLRCVWLCVLHVAGLSGLPAEQRAAHSRSGDSFSSPQHLPFFSWHLAPPLPFAPSPRTQPPCQQQQQGRRPCWESAILCCCWACTQCHGSGELFPLRALHHAATRWPSLLWSSLHLSLQGPHRCQAPARSNLGTPTLAGAALRHGGGGRRGRGSDL